MIVFLHTELSLCWISYTYMVKYKMVMNKKRHFFAQFSRLLLVVCAMTLATQSWGQSISNFKVKSTSGHAAFLEWDSVAGCTGYVLNCYHDGDPSTGVQTTVTTPYCLLQGLTDMTGYTVQIRTAEQTSWDQSKDFATPCSGSGGTVTLGRLNQESNFTVPLNNYYNYSYAQMRYSAIALGNISRTIGSIKFFADNRLGTRNVEVYMGTVPSSTSTSNILPLSNFTLVYSGLTTVEHVSSDSTTMTINLTTPYNYDGINDLVIVVNDLTGNYTTSSDFAHDYIDGCSSLAWYADGAPYFQTNNPRLEQYSSVPVIEIPGDCTPTNCGSKLVAVPTTLITTTTAQIIWSDGMGSVEMEVTNGGNTIVSTFDSNTHQTELTGLLPNNIYTVRLRSLCGGDSSFWTSTSFRTNPIYIPIIYVNENANGTGDGASWDNAYTDLAEALTLGNTMGQLYGNYPQVWVAKGEYNADSLRNNGCHIYGSLEGNESTGFDMSQRNLNDSLTVLHCEHIVDHNGIWDGLFFTHSGYNDPEGEMLMLSVDMAESDAGFYLDHSTIARCTFEGLHMYGTQNFLYAQNSHISNCLFNHTSCDNFMILDNDTVLNNTFYECESWNTFIEATDSRIQNNIFFYNTFGELDLTNTVMTHNAYSTNWEFESNTNNIKLNSENNRDGYNYEESEDTIYVNLLRPEWGYYMLRSDSPMIDAGTTVALQGTDLLGNPRITGNSIDLGCYEWNEQPVCQPARELEVFNVTGTTAQFDWINFEPNTSDHTVISQIWVKAEDANNWELATTTSSDDTTVYNLQTMTNYSARVRQQCGDGWTPWSETVTFTTKCLVNFDALAPVGRDYRPASALYPSSYSRQYSQIIYTAENMGNEPRVIDTLVLSYYSTSDYALDLVIRMGNVVREGYNSNTTFITSDSLSTVFNGMVTCPASGYYGGRVKIPLDSSFLYDGFHNLVLAIDNNTGVTRNLSFYYAWAGNYPTLHNSKSSNSYLPDGTTGYKINERLWVQFNEYCDNDGCPSPEVTVDSITDSRAVVAWNNMHGTPIVEFGTDGFHFQRVNLSAEDIAAQHTAVTNLNWLTDYVVRVASICDNGDTSLWKYHGFTTITPPIERIYVTQQSQGTGDGTSWSNATNDLQRALDLAYTSYQNYHNSTDIWVAEGTYVSSDQFLLYPGTKLYGGFVGNESDNYDLSQRDWRLHETRLLSSYDDHRYALNTMNTSDDQIFSRLDGFVMRDSKNRLSVTNCDVANLYIKNIKDQGISISSTIQGDSYTDAMGNTRYHRAVTAQNIIAHNCNGIGIGATNVNVINCLSYNNTYGFYLNNSDLLNSTAVGNYNEGANLKGNSFATNNILWGNQVKNNTYGVNYQALVEDNAIFVNNAIQDMLVHNTRMEYRDSNYYLSPFNDALLGPHFAIAGTKDTTSVRDLHLTAGSVCAQKGVWDSLLTGLLPQSNNFDLGYYQDGVAPATLGGYNSHVYVSPNGNGNGSSWSNATNSLSEAAAIAQLMGLDVWVAGGTYDCDTTFKNTNIFNNVNLYGSFAGNEPANYDLSQRDFAHNRSIIDGCIRVVCMMGHNFTMDGFDIIRGVSYNIGGAVITDSVTFTNCLFKDNRPDLGGSFEGGAIYASKHANLVGCQFIHNGYLGTSYGSDSYILNTNYTSKGGAVYAPRVWAINTLFSENLASEGPAVYATNSGSRFVNCDIVRNWGQRIINTPGSTIINSIVWGNKLFGTSVFNSYDQVMYSGVEGGFTGIGNITLIQDNMTGASTPGQPAFFDPGNHDYKLLPISACIDGGSLALYNADALHSGVDGSNAPRVYGRTIDMGCFEYQGATICMDPSNVQAEVNGTAAKITWTNNVYTPDYVAGTANNGNAQVIYRPEDSNNWDTLNITDANYALLGQLQANTTYTLGVRSLCDSSYTDWVYTSFTTACPFTIPDIIIGEGHNEISANYIPSYIYYKYSYTQQIIPGSELLGLDTIKEIEFKYLGSTQTTRNWTVYAGDVWVDEFANSTAWVGTSAMTEVFSGSVSLNSAVNDGWVKITFNPPFVRDLSANMVIAVDDNTGSYISTQYFRAHQRSNYPTMYVYSDGTNYNPATPTYSGTRYSYLNNIRIPGRCAMDGCPSPLMAIRNVGADSAVIDWSNAPLVEVRYRKGDDNWTIDTTSVSPYVIRGLRHNSDYTITMRGVCADNEYSAPVSATFSTPTLPLNRIYVKSAPSRLANGSSWDNATNDLTWALATAKRCQQLYDLNTDVWVAEGTYAGHSSNANGFEMVPGVNVYGGFVGYEVENYNLDERNFEAHPTIITGEGQRRALYQPNDFTYNTRAIWDGFTFTSGYPDWLNGNGNIVYLKSYSGLINATIEGETSRNPIVVEASSGSYYDESLQTEVSTNYTSVVKNLKFVNNNVPYTSLMTFSHTAVLNSLIANNTTGGQNTCGPIGMSYCFVANCTFVNNKLDYTHYDNSGLISAGNTKLYNSIVWGNRFTTNEVPSLGCSSSSEDGVYNYCAIEGGPSTYNCIPLPANNSGSLPLYVSFADPSYSAGHSSYRADYHLQSNSVCVNAGYNNVAQLLRNRHVWITDMDYDLDGNDRIKFDTIDLGCYESNHSHTPLPVYHDGIIYVNANNTPSPTNNGTTWDSAYTDLRSALETAARLDSMTIWVAAGTYENASASNAAFVSVPNTKVYGGFVGNEPANYDLSQRNLSANVSRLDGLNRSTVVSISNNSEWDGFTIVNGYQSYSSNNPGGVMITNGVLRNSIITNCSSNKGGALKVNSALVENCEIANNNGYYGGAIYADGDAWISRCNIHDNVANRGGAFYGHNMVVTNSLIHDNGAVVGFAIFSDGYNYFAHNTFVRNYGSSPNAAAGGNFYYQDNSNTNTFDNCVIWNNRRNNGEVSGVGGFTNYWGALILPEMHHTAIEGGFNNGIGIINLASANYDPIVTSASYPLFRQPELGDYAFEANSPCVNNGRPHTCTLENHTIYQASRDTLDLLGNPRVYGTYADMGCYEHQGDADCSAPYPIKVLARDGYSAMLSWKRNVPNTPQGYQLSYFRNGGSLWTTVNVGSEGRYMMTDLTPETEYFVRVRTLCGENSYSEWSPIMRFSTDCPMRSHPIVKTGSDPYEIANGDLVPFSTYHEHHAGFVITAAELDSVPRTIDSISFQYIYGEPMTQKIGIFISPTSLAQHVSQLSQTASSNDLVFYGNVTFDSTKSGRWNGIKFNTPYLYDGRTDLMVKIINYTDGYDVAIAAADRFATHQFNERRSLYAKLINGRQDSFFYYRPNFRLPGQCDSMDCLTGILTVHDITTNSALLAYSNGHGSDSVQFQLRRTGDTYFTDIDTNGNYNGFSVLYQGNEVVLTNLAEYTSYEVQMRSVCEGNIYGEWRSVTFTTEVMPRSRVYVKNRAVGNGDGSNWDNAMSDINHALQLASGINKRYHTNTQVWVAEGVYYGDTIHRGEDAAAFYFAPGVEAYGGFAGNEIALSQRNLSQHHTILDGRNKCRVLAARNHMKATEAARMDGFVIRKGIAVKGGGVLLKRYTSINNCDIHSNYASDKGGGVFVIGNFPVDGYGYQMTGLHIKDFMTSVTNCHIHNNRATNGGGVSGNSVAMVNCLVNNNTAHGDGGGISLDSLCHYIVGSTIVRNYSQAGRGAGIAVNYTWEFNVPNDITLAKNILWGNRCSSKNKYEQIAYTSGRFIVSDIALEGGTDYFNSYYLSSENSGRFFSPNFVQPTAQAGSEYADGDWHLGDSSFCINLGRTGTWSSYQADANNEKIPYFPETDLDGNPRTLHDTIDVGCYESPLLSRGKPIYGGMIYVTTTGAGNQTGNSWNNATNSIAIAQMLAQTYEVPTIWVAEGTYYGDTARDESAFMMKPGLAVFGGFAGNESSDFDPTEISSAPRPTILDGRNVHRVLEALPPDNYNNSNQTIWYGFTIRNGRTEDGDGGGALLYNKFYLIGCTIENCSAINGGGVCMIPSDNQRIITVNDYPQEHPALINTIVRNNRALNEGGGVYSIGGLIGNCLIHNNRSQLAAGVMGEATTISNSNIIKNFSIDVEQDWVGVGLNHGGSLSGSEYNNRVSNSVFWNNYCGLAHSVEISGNATVNNSAVEGGYYGSSNINLANANDGYVMGQYYARFTDPIHDDYTLTEYSDLINQGSNNTIHLLNVDLAYNNRIFDQTIDIGAYESQTIQSTCPGIVGLRVDTATTHTATLSWHPLGNASSWMIRYGILDGESDTTIVVSDTTFTLTGLHHFRHYTAKVRAICDENLASSYSASVNFDTDCDSASVSPLTQITYFTPPQDEVVNERVDFRWTNLYGATSYDLYVWSGDSLNSPSEPLISGLHVPYADNVELPSFQHEMKYFWKVVAWNECRAHESRTVSIITNGTPWLHVTEIENSFPMSGHEMTVQWTVRNDGTGRTQPNDIWYDKIYLSRYCDIQAPGIGNSSRDQILLDSIRRPRWLMPNESYTRTATVRIPDTAMNDYYLIIITGHQSSAQPDFSFFNDSVAPSPYVPNVSGFPYPYIGSRRAITRLDGVDYYLDIDGIESMIPRYEGDQFFYKNIQIALAPLPDLKVSDIRHTTELFSNSDIPVSWTVTNHGEDDAEGSWTDRVVLVRAEDAQAAGLVDPIFGIRGTANSLPLLPLAVSKELRHNGGLAKDSSYTVSTNITVPLEVFGDFYIYVYTDCNSRVYESLNTSDNASPSPYPLHITLMPTPDLVIESIDVPDGIDMLDTVEMKVRIKNQGTGDIDSLINNWTTKVFYTQTTNFNRSQLRPFDAITSHIIIERDSVIELTFRGAMADNINGNYYFYAEADAFDNILEYNAEDNNTAISSAVPVRYPDLEVRNIVIHASDSISANEGFDVEFDVFNVGTGKAHRDIWRDGVYLAHSSVFHFAAAERVKVIRHSTGLAKDSSYHVQTHVQVPGHIAGHWYVHVYSDFDSTLFENDIEDNNHLMSNRQLNILQSDLQICDVNVPAQASSGVSIPINWKVKNTGLGIIDRQSILHHILYDNQVIDSQRVANVTIEPGMTHDFYAMITLPCTIYDSSLLSIRVDADNQIVESIENNNEFTSPFRILNPDLSVSGVSINDSVHAGTNVEVHWNLHNSGYDMSQGTLLRDSIYLSRRSDEPDTLGYKWEYVHPVAIAHGQTVEQTYTLEVPEDADGAYYLYVVTNQGKEICEGADNDGNTGRSASTQVLWSPVPNLVADSLTITNWGYTATDIDISYKIRNIGDTVCRKVFSNNIYLSPIPDTYFNDGLVYTHSISDQLEVGDVRTVRGTFTIPQTMPIGLYYVHSVVDCDNNVFERGGENDNHRVLGMFEVRANPFDLVADSIFNVDTLTWGTIASAMVSVTNNSTMSSANPRKDRLYLSADTILDAQDYLLCTNTISGNVNAGQHNDIRFNFETPFGYDSISYLIASIDHTISTEDHDYFNNVVFKPVFIKRVPVADLAVSNIEIITDSVFCGQPARMAFTVTNNGDADIQARNWRDVVYLSTDSNYSANDLPLHTTIHNNQNLAIGESYTDIIDFTIPIPNNGEYFISVMAHANKMAARTYSQQVDLDNYDPNHNNGSQLAASTDFYESNAVNNYLAHRFMVGITTPGDLVVRNIDVPDSAVLGETVTVTWDVMNKGQEVTAGNNLASLVYISTDTLFGPDDRMVAQTQPISIDLATGEYVHQSCDIRLSGLYEGNYYMIVLTDVANAFYETSERNNFNYSSFPINISVRDLPFNTPVIDTFHNMWANDYKLNVGDETNQTVRIYFTPSDSNIRAANNIYVSYNSIGDNLNYTYSSNGTVTNSPEMFIPNTMVGYYGVSVFGSAIDTTVQEGTIEADIMPFQIMEVSPNVGGNTGNVTVALKGSRFRPGMHVWLSRGSDTIVADQFTFVDYYRGYATFNLNNADTGRYDLGVSNLCEGEAELRECFTIQPGLMSEVTWTIYNTSTLRVGRPALFTIEFGNNSNVDVVNKVLSIDSPTGTFIGLTTEQVSAGTTSLRIPLKLDDRHDLVLPPGSRRSITLFGYTLASNMFIGVVEDATDEEIEEAGN